MARPRIVKETRRPIEEKEPPPRFGLRPHIWLSEQSLAIYNSRLVSGRPFDMYLSVIAEEKIRAHAVRQAPRRLEVMGFLLGEVNSWKGQTYSVVRDVGTTELKSSPSKVRFDPEAFPKLFHDLDDSGFDYVLVGWYHSHPGHTCFLSRIDLDTQRNVFNQPYHTAFVIDPINEQVKSFRLAEDGYDESAFAIFSHGPKTDLRPKSGRTRRLKVKPVTTI